MTTLQHIIETAGIHMSATAVDVNPNMPNSQEMDHWRCTFSVRGQRGSWTTPFSMGKGHNGQSPKCADVLDCILSDASGADLSFEEWCSEYGYDSDSRKAERTYNAVRHQTRRAQMFFGASLWASLLDAERE